jgi:hypothetical protein
MSTSQPMEAGSERPDEGVPAADPRAGAPAPADGFGVEGAEPDRPPAAVAGGRAPGRHADPPDDPPSRPRDDVPFRTPDPEEVGPGS